MAKFNSMYVDMLTDAILRIRVRYGEDEIPKELLNQIKNYEAMIDVIVKRKLPDRYFNFGPPNRAT